MNKIIKRLSKEDNFYYMLVSLIFLLFSNACVEQFFIGSNFAHHLFTAVTIMSMSMAILALHPESYGFKAAIGLVISTVIITGLLVTIDKAGLVILQLILMLLFFLLLIKSAVQQALFSGGKITGNHLAGSICIFLLLGIIWLVLFSLINELTPNSFSGLADMTWQGNSAGFIYFSFVTLTTLGYGDILPLTPLARFLTSMEAVVGVFYMAIVVSSLVGAAMQNKNKNKS